MTTATGAVTIGMMTGSQMGIGSVMGVAEAGSTSILTAILVVVQIIGVTIEMMAAMDIETVAIVIMAGTVADMITWTVTEVMVAAMAVTMVMTTTMTAIGAITANVIARVQAAARAEKIAMIVDRIAVIDTRPLTDSFSGSAALDLRRFA